METPPKPAGLTYAEAGVDIKAGDDAVERIKKLAASTFTPQVLRGIGAFGGFYKPDFKGISEPVLVSSVDGVGTKLKLAFMTGIHNTVGEDLVNHCINDILVHGARPLYFLDYIATGKLQPSVVADIVAGMSRGCKNAGMALVGGETAEMPDFYRAGEYDLAGCIVGVVDEPKIIDGSAVKVGDVLLGLGSNGLHTNGYSLARMAVFTQGSLRSDYYDSGLGETVAQALMKVHRCYAPLVRPLLDRFTIHGMAHITGGGIPGNLSRILPKGCQARVKKESWPVPPIFPFLSRIGSLDYEDMYSAFNMGIGYIMAVGKEDVEGITAALKLANEPVYQIGHIEAGNQGVILVD